MKVFKEKNPYPADRPILNLPENTCSELHDDYAVTQWNVGGNGYNDATAADLAQSIFKETDDSLVYAKLHHLNELDEFIL